MTTISDGRTSDRPTDSDRIVQTVLIGLGVLAIGWGAVLVLFRLHPGAWLWIGFYLAAGSAVHDTLIGPASVALGRLLRRPLRTRYAGNAIRAAWLGAGSAVLVGVPLIGSTAHRSNPTVIPGRPVLDIAVSVALMIAGAALVGGLSALGHRLRQAANGPEKLSVEPDSSPHPAP